MAMFRRSLSFIERLRLAWRKPDKLHTVATILADNWQLRALALALAFSFWVYVQVTSSKTVTYSVRIDPVKVKTNCQAIVSTTDGQVIKAVKVQIQCAQRDLDALSENNFAVQIDLSDKGEDFIPSLHLNPAEHVKYTGPSRYAHLVRIQSIEPSAVRVEIDSTTVQPLLVVTNLVGEPAEGYQVSSVSVDPPSVMVRGPAGILKSVKSVGTETINISGLKTSLQKFVPPVLPDPSLSLVDTKQVEVRVVIGTKPTKRSFKSVKVMPLGQPPHDKNVRFDPPEVSIVVEGAYDQIYATDAHTFEVYVKVGDTTSDGENSVVRPIAPANCNVISVMPQFVIVHLVEAAQ